MNRRNRIPNTTVDLYVFDRLADWEVGLVTAHLNSFEGQLLKSPFRVRSVAASLAPVTSMGGLSIHPEATLRDVDVARSRLLILPGGLGWERGDHAQAVAKAQELLQHGVSVAAICGATAGLARAGLLDARRHTSNAREYLHATGYRGGSLYQELAAVRDQHLITAGSTGVVGFARAIFEELELYPESVIEPWSDLFQTGGTEHFFGLMQAAQAAGLLSQPSG